MMRVVWELLRALWAVGCRVYTNWCAFADCSSAVWVHLVFFLGLSSGADPVVRWLFWALALYFVGGIGLFAWVDQHYAGKLKRLAAGFQDQGFRPQVEIFAKMSDAYLGIDGAARRLLAYPVDGKGHFFQLDEISSWRIVPAGKRNHRLELLTSNLQVPVFSFVLKPVVVLTTEAKLTTILGA